MGNAPSTEPNPSPSRTVTRTVNLAGISVTLSEPDVTTGTSARGVTFLLPGFTVDINEYNSLRDVLVQEKHQVMMSFPIGFGRAHRQYAQDVKAVFQAYRKTPGAVVTNKYSIVGHSAGAKVALLVAAFADPATVGTVIALDPVDLKPVEFTNTGTNPNNLSLRDTTVKVQITWAANTLGLLGGPGIDPAHNAKSIHEANKAWIAPLVEHADATHFAYTDNGGGPQGWVYRGGTKEGNAAAKASAQNLIRNMIN